MKIQKTGSVSTDNTRQVHGLTPRFSPLPGVLDLYNSEGIAGMAQRERPYLIGERQDVVVITEDLDGHRKVLHKGVTWEALNRS